MGTKGRRWKLSEESKRRISEARKGHGCHNCPHTDETKQKFYEMFRGVIWYTDGERNIFLHIGEEIPEGFYKGKTLSPEGKEAMAEFMRKHNEKRRQEKDRAEKERGSATGSEQTDKR